MEWDQIWTIIGVNIALAAIIITAVIWAVGKIDTDVKSALNRLDGHASRIDQLYQMFVDLVKEKK